MSGKDAIIIILKDIYTKITSRWYIDSVVKEKKTVWICSSWVTRKGQKDILI